MRTTDRDEIVAATARAIDPHAFADRPLVSAAMIHRQEVATRKAVEILNGPLDLIKQLLDELHEAYQAHQHLEEVLNVRGAIINNYYQNLGGAADRWRLLLTEHGRLSE